MPQDLARPLERRPTLHLPEQLVQDPPPARDMVRSIVLSGILHAVLLLIASVIMLSQLPPDLVEPITAGFGPDEDQTQLMLSAEIPAIELESHATMPVSLSAPSLAASALPPGRMELDLSAFGSRQGAMGQGGSGQGGLQAGAGEIARGIQDRVRAAGGASGEVQFSLSWHTTNDLDLHVITPAGEQISYRHRTSRCEGVLDVDMNVEPESTEPVENIRWGQRSAPMGRYTVFIHLYRWRNSQTRDQCELLAQLGEKTQLIETSVSQRERLVVQRFLYVRPTLSASRRTQLLKQFQSLQAREEEQAEAMLDKALQTETPAIRQAMLTRIVSQFAHTDAAIQAMQELTGEPK